MRYFFTIFLSALFLFALGQSNNYRSESNPYYWKNRKPYAGYWQQDIEYKIKATIDDKTDIVDAEEELTYYNNSPDTLKFVYFHLYQNAFIKGGYLESLNKTNKFYQKFGKYEASGKGTEVERLSVNGAVPKTTIDFSIMKVELPEPIMPNSSCRFSIKFKTYFDDEGTQRRRMKLFKDKWGNKQYDGVHWYPRICVYDRKFGWETDQHLGKEFYGDFGSYDVELTLPVQYVLDATGVLQNRNEALPAELRAKLDVKNFKDKPLDSQPSEIIKADGSVKTWKFHAENVHDFAWTADPTYRIGEDLATLPNGEKVSCISLSQEPHSAKWQDAAEFTKKVIETYSLDIGPYAYPKMIVADARDGMEYPMLTLDGGLSPGYYGLFAHEVGHNWFFGMVGNNETYRASLDEGFTQFLTNWSMTRIFGEIKPSKKNPYPFSRMDQTVYWGYIRDAMNHDDMPLNTHSDDFNGALNHGGGYGHVYYKTATMLYNLQYVLGDELFLAAMQHYFDQWKFCHPYFEDFRSSIINFTHVDLNWFFDQWMETTKTTDYKIKKVKHQKDSLEITFKRKGEMQMPIDFSVYTKDSVEHKFVIPNTYFAKKSDATVLPVWKGWGMLNETYSVTVPMQGKIKNVQIDPSYRLADIYQLDNSSKCPTVWSFDQGIRKSPNRKYYPLEWRPDVWYNSVDGIKAGLHLEGTYLNYKHIFSATAWYNTILAKDYKGSARNYVNYNILYRTAVAKNLFINVNTRFLDGLWLNKLGLERSVGKNVFSLYLKSMYRDKTSDLDYLLYPTDWVAGNWNNTLNLEYTRNYSYKNGSGKVNVGLRSSTVGSDYDYASAWLSTTNQVAVSKFDLRTRLYGQVITGNNVAPESKLFFAGANPEEMMENKFVRSRAFVPVDWLGYGNDVNHFQYGGGLNVRGYVGYLMPVNNEGAQYYLTSGTMGSSINAELDFDRFIPLHPRGIANYIHIDTYLFGDAGILSNKFQVNETSKYITTNVMGSAGAGTALTIKKWGKLDKAKPLVFRFDMPLYLSTSPFVDGQNFRFRWIVSVNRAF